MRQEFRAMLAKVAAMASDTEPEPSTSTSTEPSGSSSKGIMNPLPALCGLHKIYDGGRWRPNYG